VRGAIKLRGRNDSSLGARAALWGVNEMVGLTIASLLAGRATTPYAAFHFHRIAPYGVIANLLAMQVVSAWVMPMGILGIVTMPLGLDAEFWRQMGYGIEWMNAVGLRVASVPGAFGRVSLPRRPTGGLPATVIGRALWRQRGALVLRPKWFGSRRRFRHRFSAVAEFRPAVGASVVSPS
jgi:predicted membrane metal-binding protein